MYTYKTKKKCDIIFFLFNIFKLFKYILLPLSYKEYNI